MTISPTTEKLAVAHLTSLKKAKSEDSVPLQKNEPFCDLALVEDMKAKNIRLIAIRHGEATHNLKHLMCSSRSPGVYLTKKGVDQIENAAQKLKDCKIKTIYVSSVYRTLQTAQILGEKLEVPYQNLIVADDLREQHFGIFENHTYEEYEAHFTTYEDIFVKAVPQGESGFELFSRLHSFLKNVVKEHENETILLVTHAYNMCQINKCLMDSFEEDVPSQGEFKIYDFITSVVK